MFETSFEHAAETDWTEIFRKRKEKADVIPKGRHCGRDTIIHRDVSRNPFFCRILSERAFLRRDRIIARVSMLSTGEITQQRLARVIFVS
jgi:hypothetical protein